MGSAQTNQREARIGIALGAKRRWLNTPGEPRVKSCREAIVQQTSMTAQDFCIDYCDERCHALAEFA